MSHENEAPNQHSYHCEGMIKEVNVSEGVVTFTLEPVSPYLFEQKTDDGKIERQLLFISKEADAAKIVSSSQEFSLSSVGCKCDLNTLLTVKANRMRIMVESCLECGPMLTQKITVL